VADNILMNESDLTPPVRVDTRTERGLGCCDRGRAVRWGAGTHRSMWRPTAPSRFTHLTTQELRSLHVTHRRAQNKRIPYPHVTSTNLPRGMHGVLSSQLQDPVGQSIYIEIGQSVHLLRVSR
jgi:hypothetical protein